MEEPGWQAGSSISAIPVLGPELKSRRSLQIFTRSSDMFRRTPDIATKGDMLCMAARRSSATVNFIFKAFPSSYVTAQRYWGGEGLGKALKMKFTVDEDF